MKRLRNLIPFLLMWAAVSVQAESGERVALVIGNSAYPKAPLANPRNDAKAMSDLLRQAGFVVDQQLDTTQSELSESVARFGRAIKNPKVKFGLFYYAGHGLQQDWRNYLVPVSAEIASADEVKKKTVDVSALLTYMDQAQGRSFLVILDACRDDPFAGTYRPPAKGLSQFDAPVGSLLAYATAPGNVALDGDGENGLYTSNLLREFSVRGVRVEDAFKRVRLSVRIASNGKQIPWESTSLEEDLYLFPSQRRKLSDEEQVKQLEQEISGWVRVKSSNDHTQLASFISEYPSGSISELAQARLNRLLAARAREEAEKTQANAAAAERRREAQAQIELARLQAEHAESQRLAAEREEQTRRRAAEVEAAKQESARLEAVRQAEQQAEAARLADLHLKQAQAQAAELESQRLAAAAQRQEVARLEAAHLAAMQEAQRQAQAAAQAEGIERERQREAQEAVDARRRELARVEAARLEAQSAAAQAQRTEREREASAQAAALQAERVARERQAQAQAEAQRLALAQQAESARQAQVERIARQAQADALAEAQRAALVQQAEMARQAQLQAQAAAAHAEQMARERQAQVQAEAQRAVQARLALERLAAEKEETAARLRAATVAAASQDAGNGVSPGALVIAATPYYQGFEEHQRQYARGDVFDYRVIDVFTGLAKPLSLRVTAVDMDADRVEYNNGEYLSDTMGNILANPRGGFSTPRQFYPAELYVGKKWHTMFRQSRPTGVIYTFRYDLKVVGRETITVPAGTFSTFKIEARGFNMELNARLERNIWVAPGISGDIAHETFVRLRNGTIEQNERQELVSFRVTGSQRAQR